MKKVFGLFAITAILTACDNGDMVFENLNFDGKEIQKCADNELYFKINNSELLLVDFNQKVSGAYSSWLDPKVELDKINLLDTSKTRIYYRTYDASVNNNAICSLLAPANPKVTSEYTSIDGGTVKYIRTMAPVVKDGSVTVTYAYTINFENITLSNGTNEIKYTTYPFGTYVYDTSKMSFSFTNKIQFCEDQNALIGNNALTEAFQLNLPEDFVFPTTETTQTITLNSSTNFLYTVYQTNLPNEQDPCLPVDEEKTKVKEQWNATEGTLILQSKAGPAGYRYNLKIENMRFTKDKGSFVITNKEIGTYDTNN